MAPPKKTDKKISLEREEAWIGDAVLALFVRKWILDTHHKMEGEMFVRFTSNAFLKCHGNPTSVEAEIGRIYESDGLQPAFDWIEKHLYPKFLEKERQYQRIQESRLPRRVRKQQKK